MKKYLWVIPIIILVFLVIRGESHKLAVGAMFHNEAPFLQEWIDHHERLGVTKFYLYNNESSDGYQEVLEPYVKRGLVTLIDWESTEEHAIHGFGEFQYVPYQHGAYQDCMKRAKGTAEWVAMIDIDEFLVPNMLPREFFKRLDKEKKDKTGSLLACWKVFGTSGIYELDDGEKLSERLVMRAREDHPWNSQIKSIHQPKAVRRCLIHEAKKLHSGYAKKRLP